MVPASPPRFVAWWTLFGMRIEGIMLRGLAAAQLVEGLIELTCLTVKGVSDVDPIVCHPRIVVADSITVSDDKIFVAHCNMGGFL